MLAQYFSKSKLITLTVKHFYLSSSYCSSKPVDTKPPQSESVMDIRRRLHPPNNFERRILVWTGRFKKLEDVPPTVPIETLEKARNKMRIKVANWMMGITLLACLVVSISGKRAAERGESVSKMNEDWHKEINKAHNKQ